jgi:hypothetical protein
MEEDFKRSREAERRRSRDADRRRPTGVSVSRSIESMSSFT